MLQRLEEHCKSFGDHWSLKSSLNLCKLAMTLNHTPEPNFTSSWQNPEEAQATFLLVPSSWSHITTMFQVPNQFWANLASLRQLFGHRFKPIQGTKSSFAMYCRRRSRNCSPKSRPLIDSGPFSSATLPETNSKFAPKENESSSNHWFSWAKMFASGRNIWC